MHRLLYLFIVALLFSACSNDLDINAEYKDITIVYGLLDSRDSVHMVKINKAFLGNGNAYDMALVQDSNEYSGEAITLAVVERLDASNNVLETYTINDTIVFDRSDGTFYSPEQKLFYFTTPYAETIGTGPGATRIFLFQDSKYRIHLRVKGSDILSTTAIVNDFRFTGTVADTSATGSGAQYNVVNLRKADNSDYQDYDVKWKTKPDGKRYVARYRFRYDEVTGSTTVPKTFEGGLGTIISENSQDAVDQFKSLNGATFYNGLADVIKSNPDWATVEHRIFRGLDFIVTAANDDFNTYLTLTEPVSGIIEDRPAYSNVSGAMGIWGSRYTRSVVGKRLGPNSLEELVNGHYTVGLNFCSAIDAGSPYHCQ